MVMAMVSNLMMSSGCKLEAVCACLSAFTPDSIAMPVDKKWLSRAELLATCDSSAHVAKLTSTMHSKVDENGQTQFFVKPAGDNKDNFKDSVSGSIGDSKGADKGTEEK